MRMESFYKNTLEKLYNESGIIKINNRIIELQINKTIYLTKLQYILYYKCMIKSLYVLILTQKQEVKENIMQL